MYQFIRTRVLSLVRTSRLLQVSIILCTLFLIGFSGYLYKAKTINVHIDGKNVCLKTISGTIGQALANSNLGIYPEDIVTPARDTLIAKGLSVDVTRSVPVHLAVDGQIFATRTPAKTVGDALADLSNRYGLQIKDVDEVNISRSDPIRDQMEIKVRRAIPILVHADGKDIKKYIAPRTVADALKKLGISLGLKDKVSLALDHMLAPNDQVRVVRVAEKVEKVNSDIPYQVVSQPADFPVGLPDKIVSRGSNGLQEQTVKLTFEDGNEIDRQVLSQRVVTPPINQVVSRGAQTSISRGGETINFKRAYVMKATAYCIPGGITKTGASVHWGIVAVDPRVIPLGSKVYVDGYGDASALDTGGAIKGNRIDLYMNSQEAASTWGVRSVMVYIK